HERRFHAGCWPSVHGRIPPSSSLGERREVTRGTPKFRGGGTLVEPPREEQGQSCAGVRLVCSIAPAGLIGSRTAERSPSMATHSPAEIATSLASTSRSTAARAGGKPISCRIWADGPGGNGGSR